MKLLFQLVRESLHLSGKSQGISQTSGCSNHLTPDLLLISPRSLVGRATIDLNPEVVASNPTKVKRFFLG